MMGASGAAPGPVTGAVFKTVCGAVLPSWVGSTPMSLRQRSPSGERAGLRHRGMCAGRGFAYLSSFPATSTMLRGSSENPSTRVT